MLKRYPWVSAILFAGLLLGGGVAWRWSKLPSLEARVRSALKSGHLAAPDGACAIDLYDLLALQDPRARETIRLRGQLVDRLLPQAEIDLMHLEANAAVTGDFQQQAKIYSFLAKAVPTGRWRSEISTPCLTVIPSSRLRQPGDLWDIVVSTIRQETNFDRTPYLYVWPAQQRLDQERRAKLMARRQFSARFLFSSTFAAIDATVKDATLFDSHGTPSWGPRSSTS